MSALELSLDFVFLHFLRPSCFRDCVTVSLHVIRLNSLRMISVWIKRRKLITKKRFPVIPMYSMCQEASVCRGCAKHENSESTQADWKRKTISHCNLIPLLEILLNHSICSWTSCNWEVSFCTVSWFSLNFCTETSSTRSSWALFISPISCILRIWVSRRTFSFIDNPSWRRTCSPRDSIYLCCASCKSNLWA